MIEDGGVFTDVQDNIHPNISSDEDETHFADKYDVIRDNYETYDDDIYDENFEQPASILVTFLPENSDKFCDKLRLIKHKKEGGIVSQTFDGDIVVINDNISEC